MMEERTDFNIGDFYNKKYFTECFKLPTLVRYLLKEGSFSDEDVNKIKGKIEELNHRLLSSNLPLVISNPFEGSEHYHSFRLKVLYPGLVTGVGLNHEVSLEGEFKLGMHFDYTTGLPVIYGSSVKGVLKSYFTDYCKKEDADTNKLLDAVFEGVSMVDQKALPMFDRDVFFDAVIVKGNKEGRILCADSITPHDDNPLKNPTPITFMKIASGCEIEFRFLLKDTKKEEEVIFSAKQKEDLFKQILLDIGIGAKTNVGYGQFEEPSKVSNSVAATMPKVSNTRVIKGVSAELIVSGAVKKVKLLNFDKKYDGQSFVLEVASSAKLGRKEKLIKVDVYLDSGKVKSVKYK